LPQGKLGNGCIADGHQMIADLNANLTNWDRRLAVEVGDAGDNKAAVAFRTKNEADYVEVREPGGAGNVEVIVEWA
jgi:hypothetical protein